LNWEEIERKLREICIIEVFIGKMSRKEINELYQYIERIAENYKSLEMIFNRIKKTPLNPHEISTFMLMFILYINEGWLSLSTNYVIYALMLKEHHDIWSEHDHKFVSSFMGLFNIPLYIRLEFLSKHGYDFFSEICKRDLRNAIAHQKFKIESDGTVHVLEDGKRQSYTIKDLNKALEDATKLLSIFNEVYQSELKRIKRRLE
jgi:hypothetical protein